MSPKKNTPSKVALIEHFVSVVKSSIIMQLGILFIFVAIAFVIVAGGGIKVLGFSLIQSRVPIEVFEDLETYDKPLIDTLEHKK